jgi:hypothetical protein
LRPPRKPDFGQLPRFPTRPQNRPSLPHIGYRIGTYSDARQAMFYALDRDPTLVGWTHRGADDPGIALLESGAILTDILTFYQELYANEAFLRTATWRESIADLVKLTGYRVAPAIGGRARFSLQVRGDRPVVVPAGFQVRADLAEVPGTATFETTTTITAQPFLGELHLYAPLDARPCAPGVTALRAPGRVQLAAGDKLLLGQARGIGALDVTEIVVVDEVRAHLGETLFTIKGGLRRRNWTGTHTTSSLVAYKLGRSFKHFGHNAPPQEVTTTSSGVSAKNISYFRPYTAATRASLPANTTVAPALWPNQFPLETPVDDLPVHSRLLLRSEYHLPGTGAVYGWDFVRTVTASLKSGVRWGGLAASTSLVGIDAALDPSDYDWAKNFFFLQALRGDTTQLARFETPVAGAARAMFETNFQLILGNPDAYHLDIRKLEIHEILDEFTVHAQGVPTAVARGKQLYFFGLPAQARLLHGQDLAFVEPGVESYTRTVVAVPELTGADPATALLVPLTLADEVAHAAFDRDTPRTTVHGNLVEATEGKTQDVEVLGSGDARASFQTFDLPRAPLTYLVDAGATPPLTPQLHVWVGEREWRQVPALYGHSPADEVFVVREDPNGDSWVQFGDGATGARLPSGVDNVTAVWRVGAGAFGPLPPDTEPSLASRLDGLKGVKLPGIVTGGSPREPGGHAREAAPGRLQSLDRLVSIDDFVSEALGIGGVVRARADWELIGGVPGIVVTILMAAGRDGEANAARATLAHFNRCRGPQRVPVIVRQARFEYVFLDASVALDPRRKQADVLRDIKRALGLAGEEKSGVDGAGGLFDLGGRQLGQPEYVSRIEGIIQDVDGVAWTQVTAFGSLGTGADPARLALPAAPRPLASQLHAAPDRIFRLHSRAAATPGANSFNLTLAASPPGACHG